MAVATAGAETRHISSPRYIYFFSSFLYSTNIYLQNRLYTEYLLLSSSSSSNVYQVSRSQPVRTGWDRVRSGPVRTGLRTEAGPGQTGSEQSGPRSKKGHEYIRPVRSPVTAQEGQGPGPDQTFKH
jgi:hypothetical protein